jgi:hypothetical protein
MDCYTPKMEEAHTSEMSVNICQSSWCHILYDLNHKQHNRSNCLLRNMYKGLEKTLLVIALQCQ